MDPWLSLEGREGFLVVLVREDRTRSGDVLSDVLDYPTQNGFSSEEFIISCKWADGEGTSSH